MKHLLSIADLSREGIEKIFKKTEELKTQWKKGVVSSPLVGKSLALLFQKPSLRTRVSFEVGVRQLGGQSLYLSPDEVQLGKREAVKDVAKVLSRYVDIIMARVFAHETIVELAKHSGVPVINGLSDKLHPCQVLSDIYTILERRGGLKDLKVAFVGDGNNVANSWLLGASKLGINLSVATPEGYEPDGGVLAQAEEEAKSNGSRVEVIHDPVEAVKGAQVIYTDTWASMGQEEEKEKRERVFPPYQVNQNLLEKAKPDCLVMHCLPAHRGKEITDEVMDGPQSIVFDQAENRMHVQKGILVFLIGGG
ncbi:ornithine carbamoyltransferase [candidate division NPL-UPA2 bacterium]|nr:ornithine carbamoyltransferase [candidate division NPL-UPA2 bacterium]